MNEYGLRFVMSRVPDDDELDRLSVRFYESFDGTLGISAGRLIAHVVVTLDGQHRVAGACALTESLERQLDLEVREMDLDLVDIPEIAERVGRSRQSVQQLVRHERGPGNFPVPLGAPGGKRIWDWGCVADWFRASLKELCDEEQSLPRAELAQLDAWLAVRHIAAGVSTG